MLSSLKLFYVNLHLDSHNLLGINKYIYNLNNGGGSSFFVSSVIALNNCNRCVEF